MSYKLSKPAKIALLVGVTIFALGAVQSIALAGTRLSAKEYTAYSCLLQQSRIQGGNPVASVYNSAPNCPSLDRLPEEDQTKVLGLAVRHVMHGYGMTCVGTGCEGNY